MRVHQDTLELLLPELDEAARADVRRVTSFLRLYVDDAHSAPANCVGIDLPRARRELELQSRGLVEATLRDLLRHHLEAAVPADSFFWFGEPASDVQRCWSQLEELRSTHDELPGVPDPGESALSVAARLVDGFESAGASANECAQWRARWKRLVLGPRAGEAEFRRAVDAAIANGSVPRLRTALAGLVECLLDRGAVRDARQTLLDHFPRAGASSRLRQLLAWSRLCLDDAAGARSVLVGVKPWSGPLPLQLVELRELRREWLPMLTGRARSTPPPCADRAQESAEFERSSLGASVLGVFVFRRGQGATCLANDVAPALRARLAPWLAECEGAASAPGALQHRLLVEARAVGACLDARSARTGVLGDEETRCVFLEPILDDEGEVAGWVHVEFEHLLASAAARRAALARAWRDRVLRAGARVPAVVPAPSDPSVPSVPDGQWGGQREERRSALASDACVEHFETLVDRLGIKTAQRLWWGFTVASGTPELVAQGGLGHGFPEAPPGRRKALERALGAGGPVVFEDADERLSVHGGANSGVVLLLRVFGRTCALLAIESGRRRDFKASDLQRLQALADQAALTHRAAQFRDWHRQRYGHDVWFETEREDFAEFAHRLVLAARRAAVLAFTGPAGSGKQVLSRWAHFESARAALALEVVGPARLPSITALRATLERAHGGTLVLEDADELAPELQDELLRWIERRETDAVESGPALHLCLSRPLDEAARAGDLRGDLARRLDRVQLCIPPLSDRREDILPLVAGFARRFAAEQGVRAPAFDDEALALLWRQSWPSNVRELENLVYKLVLFRRQGETAPASELGVADVARIARPNRVELVRRLHSRHPRRSDLIAALRTTRTLTGRVNKTRAALYLGWDPDTLVARLAEAEVRDDEIMALGWRPEAAAPDLSEPESDGGSAEA